MQSKKNHKKEKTKNEKRVTNNEIYQLLIHLPRKSLIKVGKKVELEFPKGYYIYTGSAKNGLKSRIERHLRKKKKLFWHIDYFLKYGEMVDIYLYPENERTECEVNQKALALKNARVIMPKFGSSDCGCRTHLVYFRTRPDVKNFREVKR